MKDTFRLVLTAAALKVGRAAGNATGNGIGRGSLINTISVEAIQEFN